MYLQTHTDTELIIYTSEIKLHLWSGFACFFITLIIILIINNKGRETSSATTSSTLFILFPDRAVAQVPRKLLVIEKIVKHRCL